MLLRFSYCVDWLRWWACLRGPGPTDPRFVVTDALANLMDPTQRLPPAVSVLDVSAGVGASWGVLAFKRARGRLSGGPEDDLLDKHKPLERQVTCRLIFLPPDTSPDRQSRQPPRQSPRTTVCEQLDPKGEFHWVVNLIFS